MKIGFEPVMTVDIWQFLLPQFVALTLVLIVQYLLWSDFHILNSEMLPINDLKLWSVLLAVLN